MEGLVRMRSTKNASVDEMTTMNISPQYKQKEYHDLPITFTSSVSSAALIFSVHVSTTDVSGGVDDIKRAVKEGAATAYLDPTAVATLGTLLCAVNESARVLIWARVARRSRDFIVEVLSECNDEKVVGGGQGRKKEDKIQ